MDRDRRWERIKAGYDLMTRAAGEKFRSPVEAIDQSYENGITDEFIRPAVIIGESGLPVATIDSGDAVICFNFRTDRLREITIALTQKDFPDYSMQTIPLHYVTMTRYDDSFSGIEVAFDKDNVGMTLGEVVSRAGLPQLRIAETEKYPHVTFFFSGGREDVFPLEKRIMISSPKVATYDLQPEMSAFGVRDAVINELRLRDAGFICLNFANGDMVGHTGVYEAILNAVSTVDSCVGDVVRAALENGYTPMIIADHGNADNAINSDGSANTAHSLNPVPCILVSSKYDSIRDGILADVAPTVLKVMGLDIPPQMTGSPLV